MSLSPHEDPVTDLQDTEATEAQRDGVTCPGSHSK